MSTQPPQPLEVRYPVTLDAHGFVNGLDLAHMLIDNAAKLILTYVNECPGCLDAAFGKIANEVLEDHHRRRKEGENASF